MNNEEIKKKICKIIADNYLPKEMPDRLEDYKLYRFKRAAEALIAAGLKFDVSYSFTAAFNSVQAERERDLEHKLTAAEHRAEVAERALENACVVILSSRNGDQPRRLRAYYKAYLEAAERELAEEGKE